MSDRMGSEPEDEDRPESGSGAGEGAGVDMIGFRSGRRADHTGLPSYRCACPYFLYP